MVFIVVVVVVVAAAAAAVILFDLDFNQIMHDDPWKFCLLDRVCTCVHTQIDCDCNCGYM
jgi:disulfide bond formation protein DsbB